MSEAAGETTTAETTAVTETTAAETKPTETVDFWKQKAREQEKRAKENADAAKRLAEIKDAQKTREQKDAERLAALEEKAQASELRALRSEIATEFGLTVENAKALAHVPSEEGMREVAKALAGKQAEQKKQGNHVPNEGKTPTAKVGDEREFVRNLFGSGG
jgi:hypothetical protein